MRQFLKFTFATVLGIFLTFFLFVLIIAGIIGSIVSASSEMDAVKVEKNSILHITFEEEIQDRASNNPFENFDFANFESHVPMGLNNILDNLEKAASDENIKGIFLDLEMVKANMATSEEIRKALLKFKESGKFIISYAENYGQNEYYLASVSDKIYLNPAGSMEWKGLSADVLFMKEALEKLDIEMQVIRHGKFKSAVEPFMLDSMSSANEKQLSLFIHTIWENVVNNISESRGIANARLESIADSLLVRTAEDALEYHLVDSLKFEDEVISELMAYAKVEKEEDLNLVLLSTYTDAKGAISENEDSDKQVRFSRDRIAVIYASGEIKSGESVKGAMGSETISEAIREARLDEDVKAIVLRVNSPGGSALASDVIWREVVLAKKEKPVYVSMGDMAASGGYYISCAADKIYAQPSTITGSIGVFGLIPNFQGLMENKLGLHIDGVKTNRFSDGLSVTRPMSAREREAVQESVEDIYGDFIEKVANGRNMAVSSVDSIGQGRIWSGEDALDIGLVDDIGGLEKTIEDIAAAINLEEYRVKEYPKRKDPFEEFVSAFSGKIKADILESELAHQYKYYEAIQRWTNVKDIYMMRVPYEMEVH